MKLGIIFKKEFHDRYGAKIEIRDDEITIKHSFDWVIIRRKNNNSKGFIEEQFFAQAIQLMYLGEWNK